jgi:pimeloyl-ACP methyl ester carboxylesterase
MEAVMIETVVILIHGYNVKNPQDTVAHFRSHFESLDCLVESLNYGYVKLPLTLITRNPKTAARLDARCRYWKAKGKRVIVVGHSNGCAIAYLSAEKHKSPIDVALYVNPALTKDKLPCPGARSTYILHNEGDFAVKLGKWLSWLSPKTSTLHRPWGAMGRVGYRGNPRRSIFNIDCYNTYYPPHRADGHSAVFTEKNREFWLPMATKFAYYER